MFLALSDRAYVSGARCLSIFSFDSSSTTGFEFNSLRASLLTVLRVVYAIVRLNQMSKSRRHVTHLKYKHRTILTLLGRWSLP